MHTMVDCTDLQEIEADSLKACIPSDALKLSQEGGVFSGSVLIAPKICGCNIAGPRVLIKRRNSVTVKQLTELSIGLISYSNAPALEVYNTADLPEGFSYSYKIRYLPLLCLNFKLPPNYPGDAYSLVLPDFFISSLWLPRHVLQQLNDKLVEIAKDSPGELILLNWITFLEYDSTSFLFTERDSSGGTLINLLDLWQHSDLSRHTSVSQWTTLLLDVDDFFCDKEFASSLLECDICCECKSGLDFLRFQNCHHLMCRACVCSSFEHLIEGGLLAQTLSCLQCNAEAEPMEIKAILPKDIYSRYEQLLLTRCLTLMPDVAYCPRQGCETSLVLLDKNLGLCPNCDFAFCPHCLRTYHGQNRCTALGVDDVEEVDGEVLSKRMAENEASEIYLEKNCNICPSCSINYQKESGCNKMVCQYCRIIFCAVCQNIITGMDPYSHFSQGNCTNRLWDNTNFS